MDVVSVAGCDWSLARPPQLPLYGLLPQALGVAPAERLCLPQLTQGNAHTHTQTRKHTDTHIQTRSIFLLKF